MIFRPARKESSEAIMSNRRKLTIPVSFSLAHAELDSLRAEVRELRQKYHALCDSMTVEFQRDESGVVEFALLEGETRISPWYPVPTDFNG